MISEYFKQLHRRIRMHEMPMHYSPGNNETAVYCYLRCLEVMKPIKSSLELNQLKRDQYYMKQRIKEWGMDENLELARKLLDTR